MTAADPAPLLLPAIRAGMGDWVYYISFLPMQEIASRISVVDEIHTTKSLKEQLQRALTKNATKIAEYLCNQEQRFFNAIVVGSYGGHPEWHEVSVRSKEFAVPEQFQGALGFLQLDGSETLFAIDGQHRVVGIRKAVGREAELGDEEVAVIFVSGVSASKRRLDPTGFERTRRLFSTLNRYAKPVQQRDIIALDEDDVVAIVTRRLVEEHPLFVEKVAMNKNMPLPSTDRRHFTSLVALYGALDVYLRDRVKGWKDFKRERPGDKFVTKSYKSSKEYFDELCDSIVPLQEMRDAKGNDDDSDDDDAESVTATSVVTRYRKSSGGHLFFRPVGLILVTQVIRDLLDQDLSLRIAVRRITKVPMLLDAEPWANLLWDDGNNRMITAKENRSVGRLLMLYSVGGDIECLGYSEDRLKRELAGLLKREAGRVKLLRYAGARSRPR